MITSGLLRMVVYTTPVSGYLSHITDLPRDSLQRRIRLERALYLIRGCLVTPNDVVFWSASFGDQCKQDRPFSARAAVSNPYYWHRRPDFDKEAQVNQPGIDSEKPGLSTANIHAEFTAFAQPLPSIEGLPPGVLNGNQIASTSLIDAGFNLEDVADTSPIGSLSLDSDFILPTDGLIGSEDDLFANTGDSAATTLSPNVFSGTDSSNLFLDDGTTGVGGDPLASTEGEAAGIFPADSLFSIA